MVMGLSVTVGASVSLTVTVKLQLGPTLVVQFTVVVPTAKNEPEAGVQATVPQPLVVLGAKLTLAPHWPGPLATTMLLGQVIAQTPVTVTLKEQLAVFVPSLAVQFTVVVPTAKVEPEAGVQLTVTGQLSVAVGGV
jgi:hypothetical protein